MRSSFISCTYHRLFHWKEPHNSSPASLLTCAHAPREPCPSRPCPRRCPSALSTNASTLTSIMRISKLLVNTISSPYNFKTIHLHLGADLLQPCALLKSLQHILIFSSAVIWLYLFSGCDTFPEVFPAAEEAWGPFVFAEYGSTSTIEVIPSTPGQIYYNFMLQTSSINVPIIEINTY